MLLTLVCYDLKITSLSPFFAQSVCGFELSLYVGVSVTKTKNVPEKTFAFLYHSGAMGRLQLPNIIITAAIINNVIILIINTFQRY